MTPSTAPVAPTPYRLPRFLVYADMNGRIVRPSDLRRVGLAAEVIGSRVSAWVRAPSRERAREYVAGLLYRAGYPVTPTALTVPILIENDSEETPNVVSP